MQKAAQVTRRMGRSLVEFPQAEILLAALPLAKIPSRARELAASPQKVSRAHQLPPATQATKSAMKPVGKILDGLAIVFEATAFKAALFSLSFPCQH